MHYIRIALAVGLFGPAAAALSLSLRHWILNTIAMCTAAIALAIVSPFSLPVIAAWAVGGFFLSAIATTVIQQVLAFFWNAQSGNCESHDHEVIVPDLSYAILKGMLQTNQSLDNRNELSSEEPFYNDTATNFLLYTAGHFACADSDRSESHNIDTLKKAWVESEDIKDEESSCFNFGMS